MIKDKVIIKKYSNRRLYDMELKRYITLEELRDRIREGVQVQVVDSKTGEDLTEVVLIQLILETQKGQFNGLFTSEVLHQLIQYRDQSMTEFFQRYLPNILTSYIEWQQEAQNHFMHWAKLGWSANQYSRDFFMPGWNNMWGWGGGGGPSRERGPQERPGGESPVNPAYSEPNFSGANGASSELEFLKKKVIELESRLKNSKETG